MMRRKLLVLLLASLCSLAEQPVYAGEALKASPAQISFSDFRTQSPGTVHHITVRDLPPPDASDATDNGPSMIPRPAGAWPKAPPGFEVELFATGLKNPRLMRAAPNGDVFLAESHVGTIVVFRGIGADGRPQRTVEYATNLRDPFGMMTSNWLARRREARSLTSLPSSSRRRNLVTVMIRRHVALTTDIAITRHHFDAALGLLTAANAAPEPLRLLLAG